MPRRGAAARGMRRQHFRQSQRRGATYRALHAAGLLPAPPDNSRKARHEKLIELDRRLKAEWCREGNALDQQTWTYQLRAAALERPLKAEELGRALYQLAHRRGFKSNRKTDPKPEEPEVGDGEEGSKRKRKAKAAQARQEFKTGQDVQVQGRDDPKEMKEIIAALRKEIGKSTLGAFMATLNPKVRRIRGQHTDRKMYEDEFDAIIAAQKPHHKCLQDERIVKAIKSSIFFQRGLKSSRRLIGKCPLEPTKLRAQGATDCAGVSDAAEDQ